MRVQELIEITDAMNAKVISEQFYSQLEQRKKSELAFHDQHRDQQVVSNLADKDFKTLHGNKIYYQTIGL